MKTSIRLSFAPVLLLLAAVGTSQAEVPVGKQVTGTVSLQGGSASNVKWTAPLTSAYKIHVFTPKGAATTNALYQIYPNGKRAGSNKCLSTDSKYPCYEITVDQTQNQNAWTQLMLNGDPETQWNFIKSKGYVTLLTSNLTATDLLSVSALARFENRTIAIGKTYEGGIIFYIDGSGAHGLVAALMDQGTSAQWYNGSYTTTGATATAVGAGTSNTSKIVQAQGLGSYAAKLAYDLVLGGYDDWFLPSRDELHLMYANIGPGATAPLTNIGGFGSGNYWSSSESSDSNYAWAQYFISDIQHGSPKSNPFFVRAVRAF